MIDIPSFYCDDLKIVGSGALHTEAGLWASTPDGPGAIEVVAGNCCARLEITGLQPR